MDLVAEMLLEGLGARHAGRFEAARICPPMRRRLSRETTFAGALFNADRLLNRFRDYPRALRRARAEFDMFHVVDHSYAQLLHVLPAGRTVVTCHDLDTFRCLLDPAGEPRSAPFRAMTRRVLEGFQKAARVACVSRATRDELLAHGLFPPARVSVIPNGVHPDFSEEPDEVADREAARLLGGAGEDGGGVELLHVGSTIARKRIDVLLRVFAEVLRETPLARLVRVGGDFTPAQAALADELGVGRAVVTLPVLRPRVLAAVYRRAALTLLPSEREGFGLPLAESLRCGTPVVASDIPVLREVGGEAATYCGVADARAWAGEVVRLLGVREREPGAWDELRKTGVEWSRRFTWSRYVSAVADLYEGVLATSSC
jgi:glycosyltransferase involved in cell wall biosynthesis